MQGQNYSIKQWAKDDRPREKLLEKGAAVLSNSELLAILILNGSGGRSAVELAQDVLRLGKDNLNELGKLSIKELTKIKGIGEAKAITIAAALELGRRRYAAASLEKPVVSSSLDVATYLQARGFCRAFFKPGQQNQRFSNHQRRRNNRHRCRSADHFKKSAGRRCR